MLVSARAGLRLLHGGAGEKRERLRLQHPRRAGVQDGPVRPTAGGGRAGHPQREDEGRFDDVISFNRAAAPCSSLEVKLLSISVDYMAGAHCNCLMLSKLQQQLFQSRLRNNLSK